MNGLMMQYFEWHTPNDGEHWNRLAADAEHLAELGVTAVWLPPCYKGGDQNDVGYGVYDLYDLGEFDQKGTVRTKYGTKAELLAAIDRLHECGIQVYADLVLNHRGGADELERFTVVEVDPNSRQEVLTDPYDIEGWTKFTFPGRGETYSSFKWHWYHFSGLDFNNENGKSAIYMIQGEGKGWADNETVDGEKGNYDYLMNADIDYSHPEVMAETKKWLSWFITQTGVDGARLDAAKHIDATVLEELIDYVRQEHGDDFFFVAEYWHHDYGQLDEFFGLTFGKVDSFDVPLHQHLRQASLEGRNYDLRQIFDGTVVAQNPTRAVTFVDNHDSQPGEALESFVDAWFKPHAYALILLREAGFPCLFYGDYYGIDGQEGHKEVLDKLLHLRKEHAYGAQDDYADDPTCLAWVRRGTAEHPGACAVLVNTADQAQKRLFVGENRAGEVWYDAMGHHEETVTIAPDGFGEFTVPAGQVSVWINQDKGE
ncbi:alpha-amylase [Streptococcus entericus]|uniref:alpha-amylase n=1 Tax=Streptococcus entericus TaxID=155680 RepID=UPI000363403D|nr:alpha-amylase [Streptococcus entericus]